MWYNCFIIKYASLTNRLRSEKFFVHNNIISLNSNWTHPPYRSAAEWYPLIYNIYICIFFLRTYAFLGLFLISVGTGGMKSSIFAFGGDQFQLPQQEKHLLHFASKFSFAIYVGSLISTCLMPELRHSVQCLDRNTCFPLAFGVQAVMMLTAIGRYYF